MGVSFPTSSKEKLLFPGTSRVLLLWVHLWASPLISDGEGVGVRLLPLLGCNFQIEPPVAGPVKLTEKDTLPGPQQELSPFNNNSHRRAY